MVEVLQVLAQLFCFDGTLAIASIPIVVFKVFQQTGIFLNYFLAAEMFKIKNIIVIGLIFATYSHV